MHSQGSLLISHSVCQHLILVPLAGNLYLQVTKSSGQAQVESSLHREDVGLAGMMMVVMT